MQFSRYVLIIFALLVGIGTIMAQAPGAGLKKVSNATGAQIQALKQAGADIIVQEPGYIIIRTDHVEGALSVNLETFKEEEMVQRLVQIQLSDSGDVQKIVDTGVDLWEVEDNTAYAQAYDYYIEKLRGMGFTVEITAQNARIREEKK